jgi:hypothetical protein
MTEVAPVPTAPDSRCYLYLGHMQATCSLPDHFSEGISHNEIMLRLRLAWTILAGMTSVALGWPDLSPPNLFMKRNDIKFVCWHLNPMQVHSQPCSVMLTRIVLDVSSVTAARD